jgi:hypothetical protein
VEKTKRCHHLEIRERIHMGKMLNLNQGGKDLNNQSNGEVTNGELHSDRDDGNDAEENDTKHDEKSKQDTNIILEKSLGNNEETKKPDESLPSGSLVLGEKVEKEIQDKTQRGYTTEEKSSQREKYIGKESLSKELTQDTIS